MSGKDFLGERRLKPIYDLLDNGNYKKAIQEAEKVLKKQPTMTCAKVLKALALQRLGKETESFEILEAVKKEKPVSECTLQAMTACYKDFDKYTYICDIYEVASKSDPENEDMLINLFNAYVRVGDYKKQLQTALTLVQRKPKSKYQFWVVMSLLLQAVPMEELCDYFYPGMCVFKKPRDHVKEWSPVSKPFLTWAEKVVDKLVDGDSIESTNEILLAVVVMEIVEKYDGALNILSKLQPLLPDDIFAKKQADIFVKQQKWMYVFSSLKDLLKKEPDSWCLMQYFLESVYQMSSASNRHYSECIFEQADAFIKELIQVNEKESIRGVYLAQMELYELMRMRDCDPTKLLGDIDQLMLNYAVRFNRLSCCSRDLSPYLPVLIREANIILFLNSVWKAVGLNELEMPKDKDQMNFNLVNIELARMSGLYDSLCSLGAHLANRCVSYFLHCYEIFEKSAAAGESRTSDRYIILAVHQLHDQWISTNDWNFIFEAICVARLGLKISESNRQLKLLLVKLYHIIGASASAHEYYKLLDIKHLQIASLGYIHLWPCLQYGDIVHAAGLLSHSLRFYSNNHKDSSDFLSMAYKYKSYMKIPDFINILHSLDNSLDHRLVKVENVLIHLMMNNILISQLDSVIKESNWDETKWTNMNVYDVRDMKALSEMDGLGKALSCKDVEQSIHQDIALLTLREHLYKIYFVLIPLSHGESHSADASVKSDPSEDKEIKQSFSSLRDLNKDLEEIIKNLTNLDPRPLLPKTLTYPPISRLIAYHQYYFFQDISRQLNFFLGLVQDKSDPEIVQKELNRICIYFFDFTNRISKNANSTDALIKKELIQSLTLFLELVTFSCTVIQALEGFFKQKSSNKKTKRKKEVVTLTEEADNAWKEELIMDFKQTVRKNLATVDEVIEKELWSCKTCQIGNLKTISVKSSEYSEMLTSLATMVSKEIVNSHQSCLQQLKQFFSNKEKMIKS